MAYSDYHVVNTYNIFLSSANKTSGTTDNFTVALQKPLILQSPNNFFTVRIGSAEIPYVFPLINSSNNTISFSGFRNAVPFSGTFTLTNGTYNINSLNIEFASKFSDALKSALALAIAIPLSFTYDRNSGKATYSMVGTDTDATIVTIGTNTEAAVFLKCVGFSSSFQFGYTTAIARTDVTSTQNVNVSQNNSIYIRSESLTQTQNFENIVSSPTISDILAKIQIATPFQSYLLWTNQIDLEIEVSNRVIDMINLYLGTSTAYNLSLGNLDWACRLTIKEHSDVSFNQQNEDRATNMSTTDMTPLFDERQKLVDQLKNLKNKLIPKKKDAKKESQSTEDNQDQVGQSNPDS